MPFAQRLRLPWRLRTRTLACGERTLIMGIANITPDSFSGDGVLHREQAVQHALKMLDEGADMLDVGAESTRPSSGAGTEAALTAAEEQDRLLPVLQALKRERPDAVVSVDTYKASTAEAALRAGAEIVNDVSGLLWDPALAETCARARCGVALMHTRGRPKEWRTLPALSPREVTPLVGKGLRERLQAAEAAGIGFESIVLDPGYGFGKAFDANYALLAGQPDLLDLGRPLLAGVSRKSFLGRTLGQLHGGGDAPPHAREHATIAACTAAVLQGASILRVHAVRPAVEAAAIADALSQAPV